MNITLEMIRFFVFIIIGLIIFKLYRKKKGVEENPKNILLFIVVWKAIMFFILFGIDYVITEYIGKLDYYNYYYEIIFFPIILIILAFIINLLLGILLFEVIFKTIVYEIIIIIIVILELIVDNFFLFPFFSLFNPHFLTISLNF